MHVVSVYPENQPECDVARRSMDVRNQKRANTRAQVSNFNRTRLLQTTCPASSRNLIIRWKTSKQYSFEHVPICDASDWADHPFMNTGRFRGTVFHFDFQSLFFLLFQFFFSYFNSNGQFFLSSQVHDPKMFRWHRAELFRYSFGWGMLATFTRFTCLENISQISRYSF